MITIPLKKSLSVQFSKPFATFIQKSYETDPSEYLNELKQLDDLRQESIVAICSKDSLDKLAHYLGQLQKLPQRFPLGEDGIKINFAWFNCMGKENKKPVSSFDLKFEMLCVIFNIGAIYNQLAGLETFATVDGLKKACNYLLLAAGAFEYGQAKYLTGLGLPVETDLSDSALTAIGNLMLGLAQECFVLKAMMDRNVKDSTLAKLSWSTATFFESARIYSTKSPVLTELIEQITAKASLYRSTAHYRKSSEFLIASQYGKEIVKLQEADEALKEAKDLLKKLPSPLVNQINALAVSISKNLERATKDNTLIYHDHLPARGQWGECGVAVVVKATPFPDSSLCSGLEASFIFERLPSLLVSQQVRNFFQYRDQLFTELANKVDTELSTLDELFARLELPGSIQAICEPQGIPIELLIKSKEVCALGGYASVEDAKNRAIEACVACSRALTKTKTCLEEEEKEDYGLRNQFGAKWNRPLSSQLNVLLKKRIEEIVGLLTKADELDRKAFDQYDQHLPGIISLSSSEQELENAIPSSSSRNTGNNQELLSEITLALPRRDAFKSEKIEILEKASNSLQAIDLIGKAYEFEASGDMETATELVKSELMLALGEANEESEKLVNEISDYSRMIERLMAEFRSGQKPVSAQDRQVTLQELDEAYNVYKSVSTQLQAALQFYSNLLPQTEQLLQVSADFTLSRSTDAEQLKSLILQSQTSAIPASTSPIQQNANNPQGQRQEQGGNYQYPSGISSYTSPPLPARHNGPQPGMWNSSIPIQYAPANGNANPMDINAYPPNVYPVSHQSNGGYYRPQIVNNIQYPPPPPPPQANNAYYPHQVANSQQYYHQQQQQQHYHHQQQQQQPGNVQPSQPNANAFSPHPPYHYGPQGDRTNNNTNTNTNKQ